MLPRASGRAGTRRRSMEGAAVDSALVSLEKTLAIAAESIQIVYAFCPSKRPGALMPSTVLPTMASQDQGRDDGGIRQIRILVVGSIRLYREGIAEMLS